jgi:hypothetical protein
MAQLRAKRTDIKTPTEPREQTQLIEQLFANRVCKPANQEHQPPSRAKRLCQKPRKTKSQRAGEIFCRQNRIKKTKRKRNLKQV